MNTLYRVTDWNCCGPKLEEMGKTKVTDVPKGVAVLYYKEGKKYLSPQKTGTYFEVDTAQSYFEGDDGEFYLIVDEIQRAKWHENSN